MIKIVITGSHSTPAGALVEVLPQDWSVHQLGKATGPKLKRYDLLGSLFSLFRLPGLVAQYKNKLQLIKADLVVSFGGYSGLPVVLAAKILRIPVIIHEQTFGAGLAAKLTAPIASKIAVSWRSSRRYFPQSKTVLTGNPIRQKILSVRRSPQSVLYICGGSQGSQAINQAIRPILPALLKQFTVYHAYGKQSSLTKHNHYRAKKYFKAGELAKIYSRARLAIGRAGINTVAELGYLKIPAVLIPLPFTQTGEQEANARYLAKLGLAVVLPQNQMTPATLLAAIDKAKNLPRTQRGTGFPKNRTRNAAQNLFKLCSSLLPRSL